MPTSFIPIFAITRQRTGGLKQRGQLGQITKKRPCPGGVPRPSVSELRLGPWGEGRSVKFGYENKVAERFGGQKEMELFVPAPSSAAVKQKRPPTEAALL
jgi:hypothetical protein